MYKRPPTSRQILVPSCTSLFWLVRISYELLGFTFYISLGETQRYSFSTLCLMITLITMINETLLPLRYHYSPKTSLYTLFNVYVSGTLYHQFLPSFKTHILWYSLYSFLCYYYYIVVDKLTHSSQTMTCNATIFLYMLQMYFS